MAEVLTAFPAGAGDHVIRNRLANGVGALLAARVLSGIDEVTVDTVQAAIRRDTGTYLAAAPVLSEMRHGVVAFAQDEADILATIQTATPLAARIAGSRAAAQLLEHKLAADMSEIGSHTIKASYALSLDDAARGAWRYITSLRSTGATGTEIASTWLRASDPDRRVLAFAPKAPAGESALVRKLVAVSLEPTGEDALAAYAQGATAALAAAVVAVLHTYPRPRVASALSGQKTA